MTFLVKTLLHLNIRPVFDFVRNLPLLNADFYDLHPVQSEIIDPGEVQDRSKPVYLIENILVIIIMRIFVPRGNQHHFLK